MTARRCALQEMRDMLDPHTPVPPLSPAGQVRFDLVQEATPPEKLFATLQARAAIQGVELRTTQDAAGRPTFTAVKWAEKVTFTTLPELTAWLTRIDGGRP